MTRKVKIKDDKGQFVEVNLKSFNQHLEEYHAQGVSIHEEKCHYFTVNQNFRDKIKQLLDSKL
jgi:hypothetical protein